MSQIEKNYHISASPERVWQALVDPFEIGQWSEAPARISAERGAHFSLWDGEIVGKNTEVEPGRRLAQEWREKSWQRPSTVTFELRPERGGTKLSFTQDSVPLDRLEQIDLGWDEYYLGAIKKYLEQ